MASVNFLVLAVDRASPVFRGVGNAALLMAAKVRAANTAMEDSWLRNTHAAAGWFKLIQFGAPLIPVLLAGAAVGLGALNSAVVSVLPGIGALGLALVSTFTKITQATGGAGGALGQAVRQFQALKDAFAEFQNLSAPTTLPIFTEAFRGMAALLPRLVPLVQSFGNVFLRVLQDMNSHMQGAGFQKFLDWAARVGALNFDNLLRAMGNIIQTLMNLGMAFSNQGLGFTRWLEDVTGKWVTWSAALQNNRGFQNFIEFFNKNGPLLGALLSNLATLMGRFVQALAPLATITLQGLIDLTNLLNKIPPSVLTGIIAGFIGMRVALIALGIGARAAAVGMRIFTAAMWLANIAMNANPIGIVILALGLLATAFTIAYQRSATFRAIVHAALAHVGQIARATLADVRPLFDFMAAAAPRVGNAIMMLRATAVAASAAIGSAFRALFNAVIGPVTQLILNAFAGLMRTWATLLNALSKVPGFGWADAAAAAMHRAAAAASGLAGRIAALRSKSITVTTTFHNITINSIINKQANDPRGAQGAPFFARGGRPMRRRPAIVGERGPEMFVPDVPGTIITAHETAKALRGAASREGTEPLRDDGVPLEVHLHLEGKTIVQSVTAYKRNTGNRSTGIG